MLQTLVHLIRLPIAILLAALVTLIRVLALFIELPLALLSFVVQSVFSSPENIKKSWLKNFPNAFKGYSSWILNIFRWTDNRAGSKDYLPVDLRDSDSNWPTLFLNSVALLVLMTGIVVLWFGLKAGLIFFIVLLVIVGLGTAFLG